MDFGREKDNTMISEKMAAAINDQIKAEFDSAYIYLGMAAYFQDCNLPGMAHWMEKQYHEELEHAERFIEHLYERGARVKIGEIAKPKESYDGPLSVFKESLRHERYVMLYVLTIMVLILSAFRGRGAQAPAALGTNIEPEG